MKIIKYLVLSLIITSFSYAQQSGWSVIFRPPDAASTVIDFVDSLHGWVETFGGMRRTTDGGNTWSETLSENIERLNRISFIDRKYGWAIGSNPTNPYAGIYFSNDSGKTLKPFYYKQGLQLPCGKGLTLSKVIAAGLKDYPYPKTDTAVIVRTTDGGKSFSETAYLDSPLVYFKKLDFVDSLHGWIYGEYDSTGISSTPTNGMFLKTNDGGINWKRININGNPYRLRAITLIDSLRGWAWYGAVYKTTDGGNNWTLQWEKPSLMDFDFEKIFFTDLLHGWGYGNGFINGGVREVIFRTTDGGLNWLEESSDLSTACYDAVMLSNTLGYVAADEAILKYGTVTEVTRPFEIPIGYILKDCYPNPFNSTTTIEYELPERTWVELKVYDILGKEIATLVNEEQNAGSYRQYFNAGKISSGTYFYKLKSGDFQMIKQMLLIK